MPACRRSETPPVTAPVDSTPVHQIRQVRPIALKTPPAYPVASVDHALVLATVLQLEGGLTVAGAAERLGVARSTAHRLLQMLVYRDFARQDDDRVYRPGLVLELAAHSQSYTAKLRRASLPHLHRIGAMFDESVNVSIRVHETTRFIASVESRRALRVTSREGMVFPLHRTTTGMLHLASLPDPELRRYLDAHSHDDVSQRRVLLEDVNRVRRTGFALNLQRSEKGLVAIGVAVPGPEPDLVAGLAVSLPSVRYEERRLGQYVSTLRSASVDLAQDLSA
jgi:DNA-binding IclR family transcriptional regulator